MSVVGYFEAIPQKTGTELRNAIFPDGCGNIPAGVFLFMEYFCTDLNCNCQRVIIKVLHPKSESDPHPPDVATFSYTWSPGEDDVWRKTNAECSNPFLDPFHKQSSYAPDLLEFWTDMVERDKGYAQRLKTHYRELREKLGTSERHAPAFDPSSFDVPANRAERRRLRKSRPGKYSVR
ncbi:MAG: hypothetical protein NT138_23770 [Planctomycetales bacterium]|nr:hypothetical protein [Planctomycetales bacterium]